MAIPFGRYQLLKKLASGGMGQVFLARTGDEGFEKLVVVKRILPHLVEDEEFFTMFKDEARITMRLNHPNIAQIFDFGMERGIHYLAMEYVAGEDIRRLAKRVAATDQELPVGVILRIIADAAAGLDYAHKVKDSKGQPLDLVHRDVSPQNVLVGFDGAVKLIDFGVAKAAGRAQNTATGILKGKFPYMSPEQAEGESLDGRSDVFSLGIVLWELLTGKRLFKGDSEIMTQRLVKACEVPAPSTLNPALPAGLDGLVLKALARQPADRYPDAQAFRFAIEEFTLKNSVPASPAHLVAFLQPLYKDRILTEANPDALDELTSETEMDPAPAGSGRMPAQPSGGRGGMTLSGRGGHGGTEALSQAGRGSRVPLIAGMVALAVAGAGFGFWWVNRAPATQVVVNPVVVPTQVEVPVVPVVPKPPALIDFAFESEPPGAEVKLGSLSLGLTPLSKAIDPAQLPMQVQFSRDGYEPKDVALTKDSATKVAAVLVKKKVKSTTVKQPDIKTNR